MLKFEFKEVPAVLTVLGVIAVAIALLGVNPIDTNRPLDNEIRISFAILGLALLLFAAWLSIPRKAKQEPDFSRKEANDPLATNLSEKGEGTRLELVDLRGALTHMNG